MTNFNWDSYPTICRKPCQKWALYNRIISTDLVRFSGVHILLSRSVTLTVGWRELPFKKLFLFDFLIVVSFFGKIEVKC